MKGELGPVEILARFAFQSDHYGNDPDFRDAVDAVLDVAVHDKAPAMYEALMEIVHGVDPEPVEPTELRLASRLVRFEKIATSALEGL